MLLKRLNDVGYVQHIRKALLVLDYLVRTNPPSSQIQLRLIIDLRDNWMSLYRLARLRADSQGELIQQIQRLADKICDFIQKYERGEVQSGDPQQSKKTHKYSHSHTESSVSSSSSSHQHSHHKHAHTHSTTSLSSPTSQTSNSTDSSTSDDDDILTPTSSAHPRTPSAIIPTAQPITKQSSVEAKTGASSLNTSAPAALGSSTDHYSSLFAKKALAYQQQHAAAMATQPFYGSPYMQQNYSAASMYQQGMMPSAMYSQQAGAPSPVGSFFPALIPPPGTGWNCGTCTYENSRSDEKCQICLTPRAAAQTANNPGWNCEVWSVVLLHAMLPLYLSVL